MGKKRQWAITLKFGKHGLLILKRYKEFSKGLLRGISLCPKGKSDREDVLLFLRSGTGLG